jgi:hypothetical protein
VPTAKVEVIKAHDAILLLRNDSCTQNLQQRYNRLTWKVIFYYFCFFFSFLLGLKTGLRGLKFSFPLQRISLSLSNYRCRRWSSPSRRRFTGGRSPPSETATGLPLARSLTGHDRLSRRSASVLVVGHPPPGILHWRSVSGGFGGRICIRRR